MTVPPHEPSPYGQPGPGPAQPPYGTPQFPYGIQPPYGTQQSPYPPYTAPSQRTNPLAIASLVFGVIGGVLLSIIFGAVALSQIKQRGERGRGLAVAGLVLSGCWILLIGVGVTAAIITSQEEKTNVSADQQPGTGADTGSDTDTGADTGEDSDSGSKPVDDLAVGDCLERLSEGTHFAVPVVPCSAPHRAEVYAEVTLTGVVYPGESAIAKEAENRCGRRLTSIADPKKLADLDLFYFSPTRSSWADGDRRVLCLVMDPNRDRTGRMLEDGPAA